jgi:hypothetical protein
MSILPKHLLAISTAVMSTIFPGNTIAAPPHSFVYDRHQFYLYGKPYPIIGGEMDPQRVPRAYWRDRLHKARAMGLNTIFCYIYWDSLEPKPGVWDFSGNNDIAEYCHQAQLEGLKVVLRPGPYICGEHDFGGLPAWLLNIPGMIIRSNNLPFLNATYEYIRHIGTVLKPSLISSGGPILMAQVENEYGSFGNDHAYTAALRDMFRAAGFDIPLYTTDGPGLSFLEGGAISGCLAEVDGSGTKGNGGTPWNSLAARDQYVKDLSSLGPLFDGEYYTSWIRHWDEANYPDYNNPKDIAWVTQDLDWLLSNNYGFSLFMFHGGTSWGFQNGANGGHPRPLSPQITSYDYGAPLDETGRTALLYLPIRKTIQKHLQPPSALPAVPENTPLLKIPEIRLNRVASLFDQLPKPTHRFSPVNMESLGQFYGYTLYRSKIMKPVTGKLQAGDYPRDRILVYVNSKRIGVIDAHYANPQEISLNLNANDTLDLFVENLGRVNYGDPLNDQRKGIVGNVTVGKQTINNWSMFSLPLDPIQKTVPTYHPAVPGTDTPAFYRGSFNVSNVEDTLIDLPGWTKGVVWVNNHNLGRYWVVGPQNQLYLPGCYLVKGSNDIVVMELENTTTSTVRGVTQRTWKVYPDPDKPLDRMENGEPR